MVLLTKNRHWLFLALQALVFSFSGNVHARSQHGYDQCTIYKGNGIEYSILLDSTTADPQLRIAQVSRSSSSSREFMIADQVFSNGSTARFAGSGYRITSSESERVTEKDYNETIGGGCNRNTQPYWINLAIRVTDNAGNRRLSLSGKAICTHRVWQDLFGQCGQ